jgi:2-phosphosulfolactate phosphatase
MAGTKNYRVIAGYAAGERGARKAAREGAAIVVVDAFRASTTIAVLVRKDVRVIPVISIEEAAAYAEADYRIGERGSKKVWGFDFGNSPTEIEAAQLRPGATVVLSTTNGTRIIEAARDASEILASAFVNACAVADELATGAYGERVAVVGCGWEGGRASEDESAAGAILYCLRERGVGLDERARRVVDLYLVRSKESLRRNSAARRLMRLGYERDLDFCLAENTVPVIPRFEGDAFVSRQLERRWPEGLTKEPRKDPNIRQK